MYEVEQIMPNYMVFELSEWTSAELANFGFSRHCLQ